MARREMEMRNLVVPCCIVHNVVSMLPLLCSQVPTGLKYSP